MFDVTSQLVDDQLTNQQRCQGNIDVQTVRQEKTAMQAEHARMQADLNMLHVMLNDSQKRAEVVFSEAQQD